MGTSAVERTANEVLLFSVALRGVITAAGGKQDDVEAHLDSVMEELLQLGAEDPSIEAALADGSVSILVTVSAINPLQAVTQASGFIRAAIHAAGGSTPDWPDVHHGAWSMQLLGVSAGRVGVEDPCTEETRSRNPVLTPQ